jgi:hypothetical protein
MSLYERALKRMEALAGAYAQGDTPWGPDRDLVTRETAADAVMDVFATLDALRQGVGFAAEPDRAHAWHADGDLGVRRPSSFT